MKKVTKKEYCAICRRQTNQDVIYSGTSNHSETCDKSEPYVCVTTHTYYELFKCQGCEHLTLGRWQYDSELDRQYDSPDAEYFPARTYREKPKWHRKLERKYQEMLLEIYISLANNTNRLTLMGCRTIIDMYLNDKVEDVGGFEKKLDKLFEDNGISKANKETLLSAIEAGNAASHRAYSPDENILLMVVDIVENLLEQLVIENSASVIRKSTPTRGNKS